jgi:hypothetical protein
MTPECDAPPRLQCRALVAAAGQKMITRCSRSRGCALGLCSLPLNTRNQSSGNAGAGTGVGQPTKLAESGRSTCNKALESAPRAGIIGSIVMV